jgi:hypothetical protein
MKQDIQICLAELLEVMEMFVTTTEIETKILHFILEEKILSFLRFVSYMFLPSWPIIKQFNIITNKRA